MSDQERINQLNKELAIWMAAFKDVEATMLQLKAESESREDTMTLLYKENSELRKQLREWEESLEI